MAALWPALGLAVDRALLPGRQREQRHHPEQLRPEWLEQGPPAYGVLPALSSD